MKIVRCMLMCLAAYVCVAQQKDVEGCKDSPLIGRFPGNHRVQRQRGRCFQFHAEPEACQENRRRIAPDHLQFPENRK
jgi:hypothetical protein